MLTIDHIMWLYDHACKSCRHLRKGRNMCPVFETLRANPQDARLSGKVVPRVAGTAHCPYWEVKTAAK